MKFRWPWQHIPSEETVQAQERLEEIRADDARVDALVRRQMKVIRENSLAPTIMRALGTGPR